MEKRKPNRTKSKQIAFRVTEDEHSELMQLVVFSGMSQQEFFTKAIRETTITNTDGLKELVPEVKRVGNNINQLARKANEGMFISGDEILAMKKEFDEVWQLLRQSIRGQA